MFNLNRNANVKTSKTPRPARDWPTWPGAAPPARPRGAIPGAVPRAAPAEPVPTSSEEPSKNVINE